MYLDILQIILYFLILLMLVKPLGHYIACIYENRPCGLNRIFKPFEYFIYRLCSIDPEEEMNWKSYLSAMLALNFIGILAIYCLLRIQYYLPLNPEAFSAVAPDLAFNTAISFGSNTNWQAYSGEKTLSYLTQMLGITVQNFLSAATGLSLLMAFIRGLTRQEEKSLGNFWVDVTRGTLYILLPLSILLAVCLVSQGVIQNFKPYQTINSLQELSSRGSSKSEWNANTIPMGPVASQVAIKQLGSNGGGFFNTNSAHPFENPTPISNFLEMLAILLIPAAVCYSFGLMVKDTRQGWAILIAMSLIFVTGLGICFYYEQRGNPAFIRMNIDIKPETNISLGGNMEGKETRFGIVNSAIWATASTATSNGSVNAMHDSFTSLGGLVPLLMMQLGGIVFGGVGSGLYGMLIFVILTVFLSGLLVGRTPEYLGKKIEPFEMKMASLVVFIMPLIVLVFSAVGCVTDSGTHSIKNPGMHGFTEILYAFSSMGNNNGSAFAGLNANTQFYNTLGGIAMLLGRYWLAIPIIAIAGSLAQKKVVPVSSGTLPTHTPLFVTILICVVLMVGVLSFFPAASLGPIVEHLFLWGHYGQP